MTDEQIAQKIRLALRERFPDTVFQVSYVNGEFDLYTVGGKRYYEEYTNQELKDEVLEIIMDAADANYGEILEGD